MEFPLSTVSVYVENLSKTVKMISVKATFTNASIRNVTIAFSKMRFSLTLLTLINKGYTANTYSGKTVEVQ